MNAAPQERTARLGLSCVVEPGDLRLAELLTRFTAEEIWARLCEAGPPGPWRDRAAVLNLDEVAERTAHADARFIVPGDAEWPPRVGDLAAAAPVRDWGGAPVGLWVRGAGRLEEATQAAVAIVGSRAASSYGERVAAELASGLAELRYTVVSGAAYGIDAAAHRGALGAEGRSIAILAGGVDEAYPRAHSRLLESLTESGCVVSEVPVGEHPTRRRFLVRNRLIAALTSGTVVVEASLRSGARNTASWATSCGRVVMAVPGPVTSATSVTPHRLIRDGEAVLVTSVHDVLEMLRPVGEVLPEREQCGRRLDGLSPLARAVFEALPLRGGRDAGDIALRAGAALPDVMAALVGLGEAGWARSLPDGRWGLGATTDGPIPEADFPPMQEPDR